MEKYPFQNIYLILTYKCNLNCSFCLFKYNKEKECAISKFSKQLEYSIEKSTEKVYVKITGGEPFLKPRLMKHIFEVCEKHKNKIHAIGIGTNGTIKIPEFFNNIKIRTDIFLSRHSIDKILPKPTDLYSGTNKNIKFRLNCNLIKGGIDSIKKIKMYSDFMREYYGIKYICFRELNKVNVDANLMYPKQIIDYIKYYKNKLIKISDMEKFIKNDNDFVKTKINGNVYDYNSWYWYKNNIGIKFRKIDEETLIKYNFSFDEVDEYVVHPDGTLTGCWDKHLKLIRKVA